MNATDLGEVKRTMDILCSVTVLVALGYQYLRFKLCDGTTAMGRFLEGKTVMIAEGHPGVVLALETKENDSPTYVDARCITEIEAIGT